MADPYEMARLIVESPIWRRECMRRWLCFCGVCFLLGLCRVGKGKMSCVQWCGADSASLRVDACSILCAARDCWCLYVWIHHRRFQLETMPLQSLAVTRTHTAVFHCSVNCRPVRCKSSKTTCRLPNLGWVNRSSGRYWISWYFFGSGQAIYLYSSFHIVFSFLLLSMYVNPEIPLLDVRSPSRAIGHPAYFSSSMGRCRCLACSKANIDHDGFLNGVVFFAGG